MRKAVGLARGVQDPLALFGSLFENDAIDSLPLHPLQGTLPLALRREVCERLMVTSVNQVREDAATCSVRSGPWPGSEKSRSSAAPVVFLPRT